MRSADGSIARHPRWLTGLWIVVAGIGMLFLANGDVAMGVIALALVVGAIALRLGALMLGPPVGRDRQAELARPPTQQLWRYPAIFGVVGAALIAFAGGSLLGLGFESQVPAIWLSLGAILWLLAIRTAQLAVTVRLLPSLLGREQIQAIAYGREPGLAKIALRSPLVVAIVPGQVGVLRAGLVRSQLLHMCGCRSVKARIEGDPMKKTLRLTGFDFDATVAAVHDYHAAKFVEAFERCQRVAREQPAA